MNNPDDPRTWITKAESDLLNIRNNLQAKRVPWDTICFHAQQAAEKMLKAFVVSRGLAVSRTHDLVALLAESVAAGGPLETLESDCRLLTPYAVMLRYPGVSGEPSDQEGRKAVEAAQRVYDHIRMVLNPASPSCHDQ